DGERLAGVVHQVSRLRPRHQRAALYDQQGGGQAVREVRPGQAGALEGRLGADEDLVAGQAGGVISERSREVTAGRGLQQLLVVGAVPRLVQLELPVQVAFFEEGEEQHAPAVERLAVLTGDGGGRQLAVDLVVVP